jgi:hypothetical protein
VPNPERGFALATRLHTRAVVITHEASEACEVVVENKPDVLVADLLARIAQWVRDEEVGRADVYVDDRPTRSWPIRSRAERAANRPPHCGIREAASPVVRPMSTTRLLSSDRHGR